MFLELIAVGVFIALAAFLCWDAGLKLPRNALLLGGILILVFLGLLTISDWRSLAGG